MRKHYNIVISFNFKTRKDRDDWKKMVTDTGSKVLYRGEHNGTVYQKVITQKVIGEE